jgi:hypothetical protein
LFEPAPLASLRDDERAGQKPTSFCKFFSAFEANRWKGHFSGQALDGAMTAPGAICGSFDVTPTISKMRHIETFGLWSPSDWKGEMR